MKNINVSVEDGEVQKCDRGPIIEYTEAGADESNEGVEEIKHWDVQ